MYSKNNPPRIVRNCRCCNIEFKPPMRDVNRGNGWFCSRKCALEFNRGRQRSRPGERIITTCALCFKPIVRLAKKAALAKTGLQFCSRECKDKAQRIGGIPALHLPHYGSSTGKYTYRDVAFDAHGKRCNRCGYDRYESVLQVHHKDRNRGNPSPENLEVLCPTCHIEDHYLAGDGLYSGGRPSKDDGGRWEDSTPGLSGANGALSQLS